MEEEYELSFYERTEEINEGADDSLFDQFCKDKYND